MPPIWFVLFECGIYAVAAYTVYRVARRDRYEVLLMLAALVFTLFLEEAEIRSNLAYYYHAFMVMVGERPGWFPLCIGVAWGLVMYSVMRTTRGLLLPWWWLPAIDALLAVSLDFVLDPVVAADRRVAHIGEWCGTGGYPHGLAPGIGFWVWCLPPELVHAVFGIPLDNFVAWFLVVFVFSMLCRATGRFLHPQTRAWYVQVATAAAVGVASYYTVFFAIQGYGKLVLAGASQPLMLGTLLVVPAGMLVAAGGKRSRYGLEWDALLFPLGSLGFCWVAYAFAGVASRGSLAYVLFIAAVSVAVLALFVWIMLGRKPGGLIGDVLQRADASHPPVEGKVSTACIEAIDRIPDGALRNLWITQTYHDLSRELGGLTGTENVNWASFAIWASGTAGESIRGEEVPRVVRDALRLEKQLERLWDEAKASLTGAHPDGAPDDLFDLIRDAIRLVSDQVAAGNLKVFAELAPCFQAFTATFGEAECHDVEAYAAFAARFRPGPPEEDGQDLLRAAFGEYYQAMFETDARVKAQRMLLANCQVGLHEQTRLQSNIKAAMDAPLSVLFQRQLQQRAMVSAPPAKHAAALQDKLEAPSGLLKLLDRVWEDVVTDAMMSLTLPGGVGIALGEDVNESLRRGYPPALRDLTNPELAALVERYCGPPGGDDEAPRDWAVLDQRMALIVDLFRTTQQEQTLLGEPFDPEQRARLRRTLDLPRA